MEKRYYSIQWRYFNDDTTYCCHIYGTWQDALNYDKIENRDNIVHYSFDDITDIPILAKCREAAYVV